MTDPSSVGDRIDRLEMRVAYQDDAMEDLNKTITAQWTAIETLGREIARLTDRVKEAESNASPPLPDPPPPHY